MEQISPELEESPGIELSSPQQAHNEIEFLPPRYSGALPDGDPRIMGVFRLRDHPDPVVDGDTIAVLGLDATLRLIGIDTEEVFRGNNESRDRAYSDFNAYLADIYEDVEGIPKYPTPAGDLASQYARSFFSADTEVLLELDHIDRQRGFFNRYLVYVYALRDGIWVNYNLETVRSGMSPYFQKYGYSERFHHEFLEAEAEARAERRGIWNEDIRHYPDYNERIEWWDRRAQAIAHYQTQYDDQPHSIMLQNDSDWERLESLNGREVTIFGAVSEYRYDWTPARIRFSRRMGESFDLISFSPDRLEALNLERYHGEFIYVRSTLRHYEGQPQFVIDQPIAIWTE
jgi:endonuclease YncB( thermonuclease family)